jgi:hypothetical protein
MVKVGGVGAPAKSEQKRMKKLRLTTPKILESFMLDVP